MVVDVVLVVEFPLARDAGDLTDPAGCVRVGDPGPWGRPEHLAGLDRVGRDEREQLGDGPQIVVDLARVDRLVGEAPLGLTG
ncbi:hypothetical protein ACIBBE_49380 [Streptomyces sp. NPDC051644]|uniref:hypothetical protein n=1 Tax=Streptomyces sp. NPDC051644 TaxID=3365666 RepID=UPI0037972622